MLSLDEIDALTLNIKNLLQNETISIDEKDSLNKILIECLSLQYGIKWTKINSNAFKELKNKHPVLDVVNDKDIIMDNSKPLNYLIEGENLYSLKCLELVYSNKIDAIYIDPPYNTRNHSFIYKDKFEHSEWLTFMEERLIIAYKLLSREGVIFISIDDNEQASLKLLCDKIFGERNFVGDIIRKTKSMTNNVKCGFNIQHENTLVYAKDKNKLRLQGDYKDFKNYKNSDNDINGDWVSSDPTAKSIKSTNNFGIENPYTKKIDYPPVGRVWCFSKTKMKKFIKSGKIIFKEDYKDNERGFIYKRYKSELKSQYKLLNSLDGTDNRFMNQAATREFNDFELKITSDFDYPKPIAFIKYLLSYIKQDALILDFFVGSGTTGQAVLELNEEDGGNRRYIICTNNENNICEDITYERLKTVITGKRKDGSFYSDGIISNLKYLKSYALEINEDDDINYVLDEFKDGLIDLSESFLLEYLILNDVLSNDLLKLDLSKLKRVYIKDRDIMLDENWERFKNKLNVEIEFIDIHSLFIK